MVLRSVYMGSISNDIFTTMSSGHMLAKSILTGSLFNHSQVEKNLCGVPLTLYPPEIIFQCGHSIRSLKVLIYIRSYDIVMLSSNHLAVG